MARRGLTVVAYDGMVHKPRGMYVSWPVTPHREGADVETDQELYALLQSFDPYELSHVLVYRGDSVEGGAAALERLHQEYGE